MATDRTSGDGDVPGEEVTPEATEELHLPGASYLPVITAAGITLALTGVVINYFIAALGLVITIACIVRWVRETREEIADLPLEH